MKSRSNLVQTRAGLLLAALLLVLPGLGGCQVFAAIAAKMFPNETVPAAYTLPEKQVAVVFPDDLQNPISYPPLKRTLAERLSKQFVEKKLVASTVPYDKLLDLQNAEPEFNRLHVPTVGRRVGAQLVIYVSIEDFRLKDTSADTLWRGRLSARVKVVDVAKGRLWPEESAGRLVSVQQPVKENLSEAFGPELAKSLAEQLADEIINLFHEHEVPRMALPKGELDQ